MLFLVWLRIGLALLALAASLAGPRLDPAQLETGARPAERLRERFRERGADERQNLERHLDEFERMDKAQRQRLLERARALREREQELEAEMSADVRARMAKLQPELRRAELRERFRAHGRELKARLPKALRERLESATPEQRRRYMDRVIAGRERASERVLGKLGERRELSTDELEELRRLPPRQRLHALRELGRRLDRLPAEPRAH